MATFSTAFGSLSNEMEEQVAPPTLPTTQQLQAQFSGQQTQQTQQAAPQQTFASLQQQGMARPAPPPMPGASQGFLDQLRQQIATMQQAPSVYGSPQIAQMRAAQTANLAAEFSAQRQMLGEEMARRGLADSSIAAGRYGDVQGQQARALASMEAELTSRAAEAQQQRENALGNLLLGAAGEARQAETSALDLDLRTRALMQEAALEGRRMDQGDARLLAEREMEANRLSQNESQFQRSLSSDERRFAQEIDLRRQQFLSESGFTDREIRLKEIAFDQQKLEFDIQQKQRVYEFEQQLNLDRQRLSLSAQDMAMRRETFYAGLAQDQNQFMQNLAFRQQELSSAEKRFLDGLSQDEKQFSADMDLKRDIFESNKATQDQQLLIDMIEKIAPYLPEEQKRDLYARLGINTPRTTNFDYGNQIQYDANGNPIPNEGL